MSSNDLESEPVTRQRSRHAEILLADVLRRAGWKIKRASLRPREADFIAQRGKLSYAVELKMAAEGRSDRLIPLWSQAYLQAVRASGECHRPLAVVAAPNIPQRTAERVLNFAAAHAPESAAGVIDLAGLRRFRGPHLEGLESNSFEEGPLPRSLRGTPTDLFSDLNQWMLKVLLAPEVPQKFLSAPRGNYRNASELARAAEVSVMSAFRLVDQLGREGYLEESSQHLSVVRRESLFRRWHASATRRVRETPMRFLLRSDVEVEIQRILGSGRGCLALFAAAEAFGFGIVQGVPPHIYVRRIGSANTTTWKGIVPAAPGEPPDLFLRQPTAPQAVFRGQVWARDRPACDILQVWLDVSSHPSRGEEQADFIRQKVLRRVLRA